MDNKYYLNDYRNTIKSNNILKFTLLSLILVIFIEGFFIIYAMNTQRTIIIPNVSGKYVISNSSANDAYIKRMSFYLINLIENFSPNTVKSNYAEFLNYVEPSVYGRVQSVIMGNAENFIATDTSSFFVPKTIKISSDKVEVVGDKRLIMGTQVVSNQPIKVIIGYKIIEGQFEVTKYEESKNING